MDNPRYREVSKYEEFVNAYQEAGVVSRALIFGNEAWADTVITAIKNQATDCQDRLIIRVKDMCILKANQKSYFTGNKSDVVVCITNTYGAVVDLLDSAAAQDESKIGDSFAKAGVDSRELGYCLDHGKYTGTKCSKC